MSRLWIIVLGVATLALAACRDSYELVHVTVPERSRLDLGPGLVVAFVKNPAAEQPGKAS